MWTGRKVTHNPPPGGVYLATRLDKAFLRPLPQTQALKWSSTKPLSTCTPRLPTLGSPLGWALGALAGSSSFKLGVNVVSQAEVAPSSTGRLSQEGGNHRDSTEGTQGKHFMREAFLTPVSLKEILFKH